MTTTAMDIGQKELPTGWKWVKLGDVCEVVTGNTPKKADDSFYGGNTPWVKPSDLDKEMFVSASDEYLSDSGVSQARLLPEGSVLVSCIGNLGKLAIAGVSLCTNQQINALVPRRGVLSGFLFFAARTLRPQMERLAANTTVQIVNKTAFSSIPIPLPPLEEQKRIAGILDEQMAAVEEAKKAAQQRLEAAKALPAAYLREVFPSSEDELPAGWEWVKLGDLPIEIGDGNYAEKYPRQSEFLDQGVPFIRATNLNNGTVTSDDMRYISSSKHNLLVKGHLKEGDVLIVTRGGIGEVALVPNEHEDSNINAQLVRLRSDRQFLNERFLFFSLQSTPTVTQVANLLTGSALKQLPIRNLKQVSLSLPPLEDQNRIAYELDDKLAGIKLAEASIQQELDTIEAMPAALLRKAFSGGLV